MNKKQHSGIFMMEMIAVVFFFILCAGICINVFVKADRLSRQAAELNQSTAIAQSVAEVWKAEGSEGLITRFYARSHAEEKTVYVMDFNENGQPDAGDEAAYTVTVPFDNPVRDEEVEITVSRNGVAVFNLRAGRHDKS